MNALKFVAGCALAIVVGCAEEIRGPDATLTDAASPNVACNANNAENQGIETRVTLRSPGGDAGTFSPLPVRRVAGDAGIELPTITLTRSGTRVQVQQAQFVSTTELHVWITRTTNNGMPLPAGTYDVTVTNPNGTTATLTGGLRITDPPEIESIARIDPPVPMPAADPDEFRTVCNERDTRVSIRGTHFRPTDPTPIVQIVNAGGQEARRIDDADVRVVSETEIQILVRGSMDPMRRLAPGRYGLRVTNPDGDPLPGYPQGCHATRTDLITVVPPPEVRSVEPVSVCSTLMNTFTVHGAHFRLGMAITVNGMMPVPGTNVMVMRSDPMLPDYDTAQFTLAPNAVPPGGPYGLTVLNADGCSATLAPACPMGATATMNPNECMNMSGTGPRWLTFYPDPTVTSVMPILVCNGINNMLTITGTGFHATYGRPPTVTVGPAMLTGVTVVSTTTITATLPMGAAMPGGPYDVTVTIPEGCSGTLTAALTVVPPPEIQSVLPVAACSSRGTTFTVTGAHFRMGATVSLAAMPSVVGTNIMLSRSTPMLADFDRLQFTIPMAAVPVGGPYAFTINNPDGCSATLMPSCPPGTTPTAMPNQCSGAMGTGPRTLTFYPDPTVTSVMPMSICAGSSAMFAIAGTGFHSTYGVQPTVTINGQMCTGVNVTSPTMLTASAPPGVMSGGPYDVTVTLPEGCGASRTMAVTVMPGPSINAILPSRGWNMIDMPVSILGDSLMTSGSVTGIVLRGAGPGGADYPLTDVSLVDNFQINATIPAGAVPGGPYDLEVRFSGTCGSAVLRMAYTVQSTPSLTIGAVIPPFGWTGSSTPVTITGTMFQSTPRAFLVIPSRTPRLVPIRNTVFVNGTTLTATVPSGLPVGGPYDLVVINPDGGGGVLRMAFRVTMLPPPTIDDINPNQLTTAGGTITVSGANFRGTPTVTLTPVAGGAPISGSGVLVSGGGTSVRATYGAFAAPGSFIVRVTNTDENTYSEYGVLVVTNPAEKLGVFTAVTPLTVGRRGLGSVSGRINSANRFIYAVGGDGGSAAAVPLDSLEFAQLDIFGRLGSWAVQRYRLNAARTRLGLVRQAQCLYALGGSSTILTTTTLGSVERACILTFADAPVINDPMVRRVVTSALTMGSWLYRVAAIKDAADPVNPDGETLPSDEVVATLITNGTVTLTWSAVPGARAYRVYRTPMVNGTSGTETLLADNVLATTFTDDGTLTPMAASPTTTPLRVGSTGRWIALATRPLLHARGAPAATVAPDSTGALFIYALGGLGTCTGAGADVPMNCYEFASVSADGRTLGAWTAGTTTLSVARSFGSAALGVPATVPGLPVGTSIVYMTGGFDGPASSTNRTDQATVAVGGQLSAFVASSRQYGGFRAATQAFVASGTFYVLGGTMGMTPFSAGLTSSQLAQMDAAGSFSGPFSSASTNMTVPHSQHGLSNESAYFFIVGGTSTGADALTVVEQVTH